MLRKIWRALSPQSKADFWRRCFYQEVISHAETKRALQGALLDIRLLRAAMRNAND